MEVPRKLLAVCACLVLLLALGGFGPGPAAQAEQASVDTEAQSQARHWLELLDQGNYDEAYRLAAPALQEAVTPAKWRQTMIQLAAKVGPSKQRELLYGRATQDLPGAPKGHYYLAVFKPNFSREPKLLEQVALLQEADGQWRVAGYYLK